MKNSEIKVCLFIRVSTDKQEYDRQILELSTYGQTKGYTIVKTIATKISGTKKYDERPDLQELFDAAKAKQFTKVLVTEISRIGRNARDIRNTISYLHDRGISIVFKNLGSMESLDDMGNESFVTNIIIAIYSELAQEEKRILTDRIRSGIINARNKGVRIGRPEGSKISNETLLRNYPRLVIDLKKGMSLNAAKKVHNVSKGTVIKVKKAMQVSYC